jgi:hypothetical protein
MFGGGLLRRCAPRNDNTALSLRAKRSNPHPVSLRHAALFGSFFLLLAGCAMPAETVPPSACLLPAQKPMLVAELFFGRNIPGRAPVSEAEWADFVAQVITPNFPDGFTVFDGALGQSRDPQSGAIIREPPKILLAAAYPRPDLKDRIAATIEAYRARYPQKSVGLLTRWECGAF